MRVLLLGSGGREHAMAWKISQSSMLEELFIAPGNAGTRNHGKNVDLSPIDFKAVKEFVLSNEINMVVVGPEEPLVNGIHDFFLADQDLSQVPVIGPSKEGAQLEGSKDFAKQFMFKHGIPTAKYATFTSETIEQGCVFLEGMKPPYVLKADGLAAGKGVIIALTKEDAHTAINFMLEENQFGNAGSEIVIEEFLDGEEASFIVMCDGENIFPMASSQDHKRLLDNDQGPNTGGMGAYSPAPIVTPQIHDQIMKTVIEPSIQGLKKDGIIFKGFLYAGLMIKDDSIKVLEFNCRMGDPETQPILFRMKNDLFELIYDACDHKLSKHQPLWDDDFALTVVMAAKNYPNSPEKGKEVINSNYKSLTQYVFHAGTKKENEKII